MTMSQELHDERLSAYLDGELTPAERAEVEELLRTSSPHQQLVSELVSLRGSLKSLPHYMLGNEFAPRVVSAARLAAQERDAAAGSIPQEVNHTAVVLPLSRRSWLVASAGALAATAAAIAIIVFFSGPDGEVAKVKATGEGEQK